MEYNKSLSARIRRRNAQGFLGYGNHANFKNGGGDYKNKEDNHKSVNLYQGVINFLRKRGFKHPGSKKNLNQYM